MTHMQYDGELKVNGKTFRLVRNGLPHPTGVASDGTVITRDHPDGTYRGCKCSAGYYQIRVLNQTVYVHTLVYEAFVGDIPKGHEIDHINTDRTDNRVGNLRIVTHTENMRNETTVRLSRRVRLANARRASAARRIPVIGIIMDAGETVGPFASIHDAGVKCGVEPANIAAAVRGRLRSAGGYRWQKAEVGA